MVVTGGRGGQVLEQSSYIREEWRTLMMNPEEPRQGLPGKKWNAAPETYRHSVKIKNIYFA